MGLRSAEDFPCKFALHVFFLIHFYCERPKGCFLRPEEVFNNHTRADDQLSFHEQVAKAHNLAMDKLPEDFGRIMEAEINLSDIGVRIRNIDEAAQKMFATYIDDFEYSQCAGRP